MTSCSPSVCTFTLVGAAGIFCTPGDFVFWDCASAARAICVAVLIIGLLMSGRRISFGALPMDKTFVDAVLLAATSSTADCQMDRNGSRTCILSGIQNLT